MKPTAEERIGGWLDQLTVEPCLSPGAVSALRGVVSQAYADGAASRDGAVAQARKDAYTEGVHDQAVKIDAEIREAKEALEAHQAWSWAEANHKEATFNERMELCKYAEWMTVRALSKLSGDSTGDTYEGVPHMVVWPDVYIARADQQEARAIVDRLLAAWRETIRSRGERT